MLVLTRKKGDSILIGGGIKVTVIRINGGEVRLGIEAPREIPVFRNEVLERQSTDDSARQGEAKNDRPVDGEPCEQEPPCSFPGVTTSANGSILGGDARFCFAAAPLSADANLG